MLSFTKKIIYYNALMNCLFQCVNISCVCSRMDLQHRFHQLRHDLGAPLFSLLRRRRPDVRPSPDDQLRLHPQPRESRILSGNAVRVLRRQRNALYRYSIIMCSYYKLSCEKKTRLKKNCFQVQ